MGSEEDKGMVLSHMAELNRIEFSARLRGRDRN